MKTFSFNLFVLLAFSVLGLSLSSCNKDKENDPKPQEFEDIRDYAAGDYAYHISWSEVDINGNLTPVADIDPITGTVELRKHNVSTHAIELWENGELFIDFSDVVETTEGFTFNIYPVDVDMDGDMVHFIPFYEYSMEGDLHAGVFYKTSKELKFAWYTDLNGMDLVLQFIAEKK